MSEVRTEYLFDLIVDLDWEGTVRLGNTPQGTRGIVYVTGGKVEGPKVNGVVLPGGGDWFLRRPDGATVLDVRVAFRADDGQVVYTYYRGINYTPPEVRERQERGEVVDPSESYFRTTPVFETASEKYGWMNRVVAIGIGKRSPTGVAYKVYAVL